MHSLSVLVAVALVGCALAYDFKDSLYNELLKADLEENIDTEGVLSHHRAARDTSAENKDEDKKCHGRDHWHKSSCCTDTDDIKWRSEEKREMKKQCFAEVRAAANKGRATPVEDSMDIFSCERINKTKAEIVCVVECVGRKQNLVDANGDLKDPEVNAYVKEKLITSAEWQKAIADSVIAKCTAEAKEEAKKPRAAGACNPSSIKFAHCAWREVQMACPADKIKDSEKCKKFLEKLAKKDIHHDVEHVEAN